MLLVPGSVLVNERLTAVALSSTTQLVIMIMPAKLFNISSRWFLMGILLSFIVADSQPRGLRS